MTSILYYLLQVITASGILYSYYHFAMRNNRFHKYNRFYLLAATVISIVIPFFNITVYFSEIETQSSFVLQTLTTISPDTTVEYPTLNIPEVHTNWLTWENLSYLIYIIIAFIILLRILFSLFKIRSIIKANIIEPIDNIHFINTDEPSTPFSFFQWLFWNKKIELHSEKGEQIFRHELFHIRQKHSWDIMYLEILTVFFWINPFFHLIKKETKAIHEFLADQFAVSENKKWEYAELLLMQILNTKQQLVNPFFHNQIKRRIAMLTTSKKPSYQYARKLMVLPVAAIVIGLFAFSYKEKQKDKKETVLKSIQVVSDTIRPQSVDNRVYDKVDIEASFPGGEQGWRKYLQQNADATIPLENKAPGGQYTVVIQFIVSKDGSISDIKPLTKHGYGMEKEAMRVIKNTAKWNPAIKEGKIVKAYKKQPLSFEITRGNSKSNSQSVIKFFDSHNDNKSTSTGAIFVIDGIIGESINSVKVNDISSLTILKGQDAINKYGDQGKNGVVEVITKKGASAEILYVEKNTISEADKLSVKAKIEPSFPGGDAQWRKYLERNLDASVPRKQNAPEKAYTTVIQFIVDKEGNITNVKPLTNQDYGMEEEAVRIIKAGPKWVPALVDGQPVSAYKKQAITFMVANGENHFPPADYTISNELNEVVVISYPLTKDKNDQKLTTNGDLLFDKVEIEPAFPGGDAKFKKYVNAQLNQLIPVRNGAPVRTYTVIVQFVVKTDGFLTNIKTLTNHGYGMEEEATRLIRNGPRWLPAIQNGKQVNAIRNQPVTFVVGEKAITQSQPIAAAAAQIPYVSLETN